MNNKFITLIVVVCSVFSTPTQTKSDPLPEWTFVLYIAARNSLSSFVEQTLNQIAVHRKLKNINVVLQVDKTGNKHIERMALVKGRLKVIERLPQTQKTISGTQESLFECVKWSHKKFPSKKLALIISNHGSGPLDPEISRAYKGIAFNDKYKTYLTTKQLGATLKKIRYNVLDGKKIDLIGFDACHMSAIEICYQIMHSAKVMVASQEAELGRGWDYETILAPFAKKKVAKQYLDYEGLASHIVGMYKKQYHPWMPRYTLAAISLEDIKHLHKDLDGFFKLLNAITKNKKMSRKLIAIFRKIRKSKHLTTSFYSSEYVDLIQLLKALQQFLRADGDQVHNKLQSELKSVLKYIISKLQRSIFARVAGSDLPFAHGFSIYYPTEQICTDYYEIKFAQISGWPKLMSKLVMH